MWRPFPPSPAARSVTGRGAGRRLLDRRKPLSGTWLAVRIQTTLAVTNTAATQKPGCQPGSNHRKRGAVGSGRDAAALYRATRRARSTWCRDPEDRAVGRGWRIPTVSRYAAWQSPHERRCSTRNERWHHRGLVDQRPTVHLSGADQSLVGGSRGSDPAATRLRDGFHEQIPTPNYPHSLPNPFRSFLKTPSRTV
jgi:hypothetical protein